MSIPVLFVVGGLWLITELVLAIRDHRRALKDES